MADQSEDTGILSHPHQAEQTCTESKTLESYLKDAKGLVFDVDGTLVDTMPIYYESWKRSCDELSLVLTEDRFYSLAGVPVADIFAMLVDEQLQHVEEKKRPTPEYCEQIKKKYHLLMEEEGMLAGPIENVVEIAQSYHGKLPMACASSGWRDHVVANLKRLGIFHLFDHIVTNCDKEVKTPKPAPDIFLVAARRLGVDPTKCIGFEDGDFGMTAIKSADFLYACDVRNMRKYPRNIKK